MSSLDSVSNPVADAAAVPVSSPADAPAAPAVDAAALPVSESRKNHFNLMRLTLAGLVMLTHATGLVDGDNARDPITRIFHTHTLGALAVDGFFLLSGFLIVQSWVRDPSLWRFLKKRVLRIYPAFIVAWLISALFVGWIGSASSHYFREFPYGTIFTRMLLLKPPKEIAVFAGTHGAMVNASMWTIAYEFQCYLIVAGVGLCGLLRWRVLWLIFSIVMIGVFIFLKSAQHQVIMGHEFDKFSRPGLLSFLMFFTVGGSFYLYRDWIPLRTRWAIPAAVIFVVCLYGVSSALLALATVGAYFFFWLAFTKPRFKSPIAIRTDISYGLYLYGWPTQKLVMWCWPMLSPWTLTLISVPLAAAAGWVSWHLVEERFLRFKPKARKEVIAVAA